MEWYWWVLIALAVIVLGYLKLKIWNSIQNNQKKKAAASLEEDE